MIPAGMKHEDLVSKLAVKSGVRIVRFRIDGEQLLLAPGLWHRAPELAASPLELVEETKVIGFGGGQAILRQGDVLVGGSDSRKDGSAAGF